MHWQPLHGRPIVGGQSGYPPTWYGPAQMVLNRFPEPASLDLLDAWGIESVVIEKAWRRRDPRGRTGARGRREMWA